MLVKEVKFIDSYNNTQEEMKTLDSKIFHFVENIKVSNISFYLLLDRIGEVCINPIGLTQNSGVSSATLPTPGTVVLLSQVISVKDYVVYNVSSVWQYLDFEATRKEMV